MYRLLKSSSKMMIFSRAHQAFKESLPTELRDVTFKGLQDKFLQGRISQLIKKVDDAKPPTTTYLKKLFG